MPRPIEEVMAAHSGPLMAIPGVAGLYESETSAGAPCIKIMLDGISEAARAALPDTLDGYPIIPVDAGPVGPR